MKKRISFSANWGPMQGVQLTLAGLLALVVLVHTSTAQPPQAKPIAIEKLDLALSKDAQRVGVSTRRVIPGEIKEVTTDVVSIVGPAKHVEPASNDHEVIWLFLVGNGTLKARDKTYQIDGETIARAPLGWLCEIDVPAGKALHALRIHKQISEDDRNELKKFAANNAAPHVKKFSECTAYNESFKSAKTTSRTLLPADYVPRVAIGTVETTGPDEVGVHAHAMLEQFFLGLSGNDIIVSADEARIPLGPMTILHIPLGSMHGAKVAAGKKLHYVWMDFFPTKEGQEWLKMHKPIVPSDRK